MDYAENLKNSTIKDLTLKILKELDKVQVNPSTCNVKKDGTRIHPYAELTITYDHEGEYYTSSMQRENWDRWEDKTFVKKYVDYGVRNSFVSRNQWDKKERRRGYKTREQWEKAVKSSVSKAKKLQNKGIKVTLWVKN